MKVNKIVLVTLIAGVSLFGFELPTQKVSMHAFKKSVALNAKVIQLSNAQQAITSLVNGHLEKYFVKPAQDVKAGDKIALIESIELSQMSAEYLSLKKQFTSISKNYAAIEKLYKKGLASQQRVSEEAIKKSEIAAKLNALKSQLQTLGIDTNRLKKATANFILYAHSSGRVSALLKPLHSSITSDEAVVSIVKNQAYYIKSYLPLSYATKVALGDKIVVSYAGEKIVTHATQIMPKLDEVTQRVIVLSSVDQKVEKLFLNAYVESRLYFGEAKRYLAVKKSALSFFNNEWVVFSQNSVGEYLIYAVKIITQDEEYVAIEGLDAGEKYISDKSYYVKSALLKSSLGDGD